MESNTSLSGLVRRSTAKSYRDYARQLARAAGVNPEARPAVVNTARAVASRSGTALHRKRGEKIERTFSHVLDSGGPRRTTLRGLANSNKRYLCAIIGLDLGPNLRKLTGVGTPRQAAAAKAALVGPWPCGCGSVWTGGRPAASPRTPWQETPLPAPHHAWHFTILTPAGGNAAFFKRLPVCYDAFLEPTGAPPPADAVCIAALFFGIAGNFAPCSAANFRDQSPLSSRSSNKPGYFLIIDGMSGNGTCSAQ